MKIQIYFHSIRLGTVFFLLIEKVFPLKLTDEYFPIIEFTITSSVDRENI